MRSALDDYSQIGLLTARMSQDAARSMLAVIVWSLFDKIKDQSHKFKIGPIPISIKVAKFAFIIELMVGPRVEMPNGLPKGT